jgi:hypothetical protein
MDAGRHRIDPASELVSRRHHRTAQDRLLYRVADVFDVETRSAIAATGALIFEVGHDYILVEATAEEAKAIAGLGLAISEVPEAEIALAFPPADSAYHDFAEMVAEIQQAAADHPAIFSLLAWASLRRAHDRAGKISDNVSVTKTSRKSCSHITSMPANI